MMRIYHTLKYRCKLKNLIKLFLQKITVKENRFSRITSNVRAYSCMRSKTSSDGRRLLPAVTRAATDQRFIWEQ
jgi:hypothetical protein